MITTCEKCGGLRAEPGEFFAGRGCGCPRAPKYSITTDDLFEIHNLATRIQQSRQNVGTLLKLNAETVLKICTRINRRDE